jgi:hypothetical protein
LLRIEHTLFVHRCRTVIRADLIESAKDEPLIPVKAVTSVEDPKDVWISQPLALEKTASISSSANKFASACAWDFASELSGHSE